MSERLIARSGHIKKECLMETAVRTYSADEKLIRKRRNQITHCALKLFLEKGYKDTTMREIGDACKMSQGAVYRWIGSKDDILHLICLEKSHGDADIMTFVQALGDVTATVALEEIMRKYFWWEDMDRDYILFFNSEIKNFSREDRHLLLVSSVKQVDAFETVLQKGIQSGEFKIDNVKLMAHNIQMMGQDWALRRWYLKRHFTLESYTRKQTDWVLREVTKGNAVRNKEIRMTT